jgi:hypothetical protein
MQPAYRVAEYASATITFERVPTQKATIVFECAAHGTRKVLACFPGSGETWSFCVWATDSFDWRFLGLKLPPVKKAA